MGGNGVTLHWWADQTEFRPQFIAPNDGNGVILGATVPVHVGSVLDFALDPTDSNDLLDNTRLIVQITVAPIASPVR